MTKATTLEISKENSSVAAMFNRIARRYDLLNRLLSFGQDQVWRRKLALYLNDASNQTILDVATGTGDVLLMLASTTRKVQTGIGIDTAEQMLAIGREKIHAANMDASLRLEYGDATSLQFQNASFDATSIAFGIRNVQNVPAALSEMHRVLKPGGKCLILEFSLPENKLIRAGYLFYFRNILPLIGGSISGDKAAYSYLNRTVETFPYGDAFMQLMRTAGFKTVEAHPLTLGVATIYTGVKA